MISIVLEIFVQYLLNKSHIDLVKNFVYKKYLSNQVPNIITNVNSSNSRIYLDILDKKVYLNQLWYPIFIYNCSILSSDRILHKIFQRCSLISINSNDVCKLIQKYPILKHLKFEQILSRLIFIQKRKKCLFWNVSVREIHIYNDLDPTVPKGVIKVLEKSNDELFYTILFIGKLNGTFIDSARNLGLEEHCIEDIVKSLQYQLDFRKLHQGDRFAILISSHKMHGEKKLKNTLIGARLQSSGKDYYIFRANNGKFYNKEAIRLNNAFIRFPLLHPYRISSNFNLNRLNPVTGLISPHAGVDFAVPIGTPVLAVGDGEVIVSKYSKIAGNYVGIKHNYQCMTRYMHLKKVLVKPGQKVRQGQQIALSGNTGRSTGPHLHFEVWINHHPVNPLTANILNTERLLGNERIKYLHQINKIVPKLKFD